MEKELLGFVRDYYGVLWTYGKPTLEIYQNVF